MIYCLPWCSLWKRSTSWQEAWGRARLLTSCERKRKEMAPPCRFFKEGMVLMTLNLARHHLLNVSTSSQQHPAGNQMLLPHGHLRDNPYPSHSTSPARLEKRNPSRISFILHRGLPLPGFSSPMNAMHHRFRDSDRVLG